MWTVLTLDLSKSNLFTWPPLLLPFLEEKDLININLLEDFIFWAPSEDSDKESHHSLILILSPATKVVEEAHSSSGEVHSSSEEVVLTDSDPSVDGSYDGDEVMSGPEADSSADDENEEMSSSEEEDEDPIEDLS